MLFHGLTVSLLKVIISKYVTFYFFIGEQLRNLVILVQEPCYFHFTERAAEARTGIKDLT